jgi:hypothetical protein
MLFWGDRMNGFCSADRKHLLYGIESCFKRKSEQAIYDGIENAKIRLLTATDYISEKIFKAEENPYMPKILNIEDSAGFDIAASEILSDINSRFRGMIEFYSINNIKDDLDFLELV